MIEKISDFEAQYDSMLDELRESVEDVLTEDEYEVFDELIYDFQFVDMLKGLQQLFIDKGLIEDKYQKMTGQSDFYDAFKEQIK